ncbi:hypothetical protein E2C01_023679 [Portunus trituberculatus]|uniref:Uncharacterized protein n=1 Tax=Portunus trituberculatus TaxID=210409 RepID=A0A5B7EAP0_PORTR|nr:hypothetical protein [Portunus trituberculatus]
MCILARNVTMTSVHTPVHVTAHEILQVSPIPYRCSDGLKHSCHHHTDTVIRCGTLDVAREGTQN